MIRRRAQDYSKTLNNRARFIIFEMGWGPGCSVGGPGGGVLNVSSSSGSPLLLFPLITTTRTTNTATRNPAYLESHDPSAILESLEYTGALSLRKWALLRFSWVSARFLLGFPNKSLAKT